MTDQEILNEINKAKELKRLGQFDAALTILHNAERKIEPEDGDHLLLGHLYKAQGKIHFIQGQDEDCYVRCLLAARVFAIHGDQAEAFNIAGTLGCMHPHFQQYRSQYAASLQGLTPFTNREVAMEMAQTGISALQAYFSS